MPQRRDRHHDGADNGAHHQLQIDELAREQGHFGVVEARLGANGPGLGVHLVVQRGEHAHVQHIGAGAVQRPGFHEGAGALLEVGYLVLRDGEFDVDRRQLRQQRDAVHVTRIDDIADVHGAQADPARDRGHDARVAQVQAGRSFIGPVDHHRAFELLDQRRLRVHLLPRDRILLQQRAEPGQRHPGVFQLRLVALPLPHRLLQRHLELARVDGGEQVALLHDLAFFK